jgi:hypothetical protein
VELYEKMRVFSTEKLGLEEYKRAEGELYISIRKNTDGIEKVSNKVGSVLGFIDKYMPIKIQS